MLVVRIYSSKSVDGLKEYEVYCNGIYLDCFYSKTVVDNYLAQRYPGDEVIWKEI